MVIPKQRPIELEVRCEYCGGLDWFLLEQLKLCGGRVYCRTCLKIYDVDIGGKNSKSYVENIVDADLDFVRKMLKAQNFTSGEIENMIAGAFSRGLEFTNREDLVKVCLECYPT